MSTPRGAGRTLGGHLPAEVSGQGSEEKPLEAALRPRCPLSIEQGAISDPGEPQMVRVPTLLSATKLLKRPSPKRRV